MWFKNLSLLRFTEPFTLTAEQLEEKLQGGRFQPCSSLQPMSYGFVPPVGKEDAPLAHAAGGCFMICAQREEKILPASVVNEMLAEKVAEIEERKGTTVRKKGRNAIRDEIIHDLLPRAFSFSRRLYAYIDPNTGWLVVDSASAKKTEELASWLRRCLESLPVVLPAVTERPAAVMTRWLAEEGTVPADIVIENECELRATDEEGAVIRCKKHDLGAPEIQNHLEAGKEAVKIAVSWNDRLSFLVDDALGIKRLRFLDLVQEQAADVDAADGAERFDADFDIMSWGVGGFPAALAGTFRRRKHPKETLLKHKCSGAMSGHIISYAARRLFVGLLLVLSPVLAQAEFLDLPPPNEDLVGHMRYVKARQGDTLIDIAHDHSVGQDEMVMANPTVSRTGSQGKAPKFRFQTFSSCRCPPRRHRRQHPGNAAVLFSRRAKVKSRPPRSSPTRSAWAHGSGSRRWA